LRQLILGLLITGALCAQAIAAGDEEAALQADQALFQAMAKADTTAVRRALDGRLAWTDAQGKTLTKKEVKRLLPKPTDLSGAETKVRLYGRIAIITSNRDNVYLMRIWAKRARGWRAVVYHEVMVPPAVETTAAIAAAVRDCENPCKTLPLKPRSPDERGVIESWQALETAVSTGKGADWAPHTAEEFMVVGPNSVQSKEQRLAVVSAAASAPPPVVSAKLYDFDDGIVMVAEHQPYSGKPIHVTRFFTKRDGVWQLVISYQTAVQDVSAQAPAQTQTH
jgi:hypothetical protein